MSRRIYFSLLNETDWTKTIEPDFGSYAVLLFYTDNLNPEMAEKMVYFSLSEYSYRSEKELPMGEYVWENFLGHSNLDEIEEILHFMDNKLLPTLQGESRDLDIIFDIYKGKEKFVDLYYGNPYLQILSVLMMKFMKDIPAIYLI